MFLPKLPKHHLLQSSEHIDKWMKSSRNVAESFSVPFSACRTLKTLLIVTGNTSPPKPLHIFSQRETEEERRLFIYRKFRPGKKRSKEYNSILLPRRATRPTATGRGSFTTALNAGNSLVNCCPPACHLSHLTCLIYLIFFQNYSS